MKIVIRIVVWVSMCLPIFFVDSETDLFSWKSVVPYFQNLCQFDETCNDTAFDKETNNGKQNICCKGCFCEEACSNKPITKLYAGQSKCIKTIGDKSVVNEYSFVVGPPKDGCVTDYTKLNGTKPSCDKEIVSAPWGGNFYPVYSFDKMVNFKNEHCALCHGTNNISKWSVYALFKGEISQRLGVLTNYYKNFNSTEIDLEFYPPNRESQAFEHMCNTIESRCGIFSQEPFYVPTYIKLTREEIIQACYGGIVSPYMVSESLVFKNVFCAICNGQATKILNSVRCEIINDQEDGIRGDGISFTSLINPEYIDSKAKKTTQSAITAITEFACLPKDAYGRLTEPSCREVLCPALQVRRLDGSCDYPMEKIYMDKIYLALNLTTTDGSFANSLQNMSSEEIATIFKKSMPWVEKWELIVVMLRTDLLYKDSTEFLVFIGCMYFKFVDIRYLKRIITASLSRKWPIFIGQRTELKQEFHKHGSYERRFEGDVEIIEPLWSLKRGNVTLLDGLSTPTWQMLFSNLASFSYKRPGEPVEISKLYFCNQIALQNDEYVGISSGFPVFLKRQNEYLFPSQFYINNGANGSDVINICLEDSDFKIIRESNIGIRYRIAIDCVFVVLSVQLFI